MSTIITATAAQFASTMRALKVVTDARPKALEDLAFAKITATPGGQATLEAIDTRLLIEVSLPTEADEPTTTLVNPDHVLGWLGRVTKADRCTPAKLEWSAPEPAVASFTFRDRTTLLGCHDMDAYPRTDSLWLRASSGMDPFSMTPAMLRHVADIGKAMEAEGVHFAASDGSEPCVVELIGALAPTRLLFMPCRQR